MKRKILSLLLALCMAVTLFAVPAGAAGPSGFSDVGDRNTAVAAECLRLMGVLDGYGDGTFRPGITLNRAQFCKMAVYAMNASSELGKYRAVTVYPDVKPGHWAAAYINLASKGKQVILGFADGLFHPDAAVTAGQAVTILMRMLGYKDGDVGAIWPDGYLAQAKVIGLLDGLSLNASAPLNRGQAAGLFMNLLRTDRKDGGAFGEAAAKEYGGSAIANVMLVSSAATGSDGQKTAMELGGGSQTYQMANKASNGLLNGRMGTLLLDKNGKVLTFVPNASGATKLAVISEAAANRLTVTSGESYGISSSVKVHYGGSEQSWSSVFSYLTPGLSVTLYLNAAGNVEYVFVGGSGSTASQAVVVYQNGSTAGFSALAGGLNSYQIIKNGIRAVAADMRPYDVATYSSATNTIRVTDLRITGVYESCSPNPDAPTELRALGTTFDVLPSAHESLRKLKVGSVITLLLTEDNQVAGAVKAEGSGAQGNAVGVLEGGAVRLLNGLTVSGSVGSGGASLNKQLVRVSSSKAGTLTVSRLAGGVSGALDVTARKLGGRDLAPNALIFQESGSDPKAVSLSELGGGTIRYSDIRYARANWKNQIDLVVLGSRQTTVEYVYGRAVVEREYSEDGQSSTVYLKVEYGPGKSTPSLLTGADVRSGEYVKAFFSGGQSLFTEVEALTKLAGVPNTAWVGRGAVTVNARTYTVPGGVPCYNASSGKWVTLDEAHAFAGQCDLYVEDGTVRVIEVKQ